MHHNPHPLRVFVTSVGLFFAALARGLADAALGLAHLLNIGAESVAKGHHKPRIIEADWSPVEGATNNDGDPPRRDNQRALEDQR